MFGRDFFPLHLIGVDEKRGIIEMFLVIDVADEALLS